MKRRKRRRPLPRHGTASPWRSITSCDDWDYARAADYLLDRMRKLRNECRKGLHYFRRRSHGESSRRTRAQADATSTLRFTVRRKSREKTLRC